MQIITTGISRLEYPIGENICHNIIPIKQMAMKIASLKQYCHSFPGISGHKILVLYCTGSSGAIMSAIIADYLLQSLEYDKVEIIYVNKETEPSHRPIKLDKPKKHVHNVVVDDIIATGATIKHILNALRDSGLESDLDIVVSSANMISCGHLENIIPTIKHLSV